MCRRLRLSNKQIAAAVDASGAMEFLQASGFQMVFEPDEASGAEEGYTALPYASAEAAQVTRVRVFTAEGCMTSKRPAKQLVSGQLRCLAFMQLRFASEERNCPMAAQGCVAVAGSVSYG